MAEEEPQCPVMIPAAGVPVAVNRNSLPAGARGPGSVTDSPPGTWRPHTGR